MGLTWRQLIASASPAKVVRGFTVNVSLHRAGGVRLQAGGLPGVVWTELVLCHKNATAKSKEAFWWMIKCRSSQTNMFS